MPCDMLKLMLIFLNPGLRKVRPGLRKFRPGLRKIDIRLSISQGRYNKVIPGKQGAWKAPNWREKKLDASHF